ncbi:flagellar biosynthesis protein FlhB [Glaciecola sp. KUL10]|uniref:flagellar biosynthesis protein FlhB n=1 Tax=Glaciecola sp. (strain KUL10) TaxID=2161813 RepID=UPI000D78A48C|nr:flagellar biosynthesis protein FlhB [Glaciecola sp. KUL10]GBL04034.1 flagellar biosynthetic protein FlhB [Glaciecola sp. KUL10]
MADNDSFEKTEEPTAKKLEDARKKGQIARSKELSTTLVLISSAVALLSIGSMLASAMYTVFRRSFILSRDETYDKDHMFQILDMSVSESSTPVLIFMVIALVGGFYGNIAMGGFNFTWQSAAPKANRLSPVQGFKRMFGVEALVELLKGIAKVGVIMLMAYISLIVFKDEALHLDMELYPLSIFHALEMIEWAFLLLCLGMIPIAIIDVPFQSHKHHKEMKMTLQEVKDERKNSEGDPQTKGRIRRLQYQASANRMMQDVPSADVIVTNPTHYSVALKYEDNGERAPVLVAKGIDELAMHIRKIGGAHGIPIIESPMLARAIYYSTEANQEIPHKLFMAVAQVLAYVYQLKAYKKGKGKRPKPLKKEFDIPPELRR